MTIETGIYRPTHGTYLPLHKSSTYIRIVDQGVQGVLEIRVLPNSPSVQHIIGSDGYSIILPEFIDRYESMVRISYGRAIDLIEEGPCA